MRGALGFSRWASLPARHCPGARALALAHESGWALVYSGDTAAPCAEMERAARRALLLPTPDAAEGGRAAQKQQPQQPQQPQTAASAQQHHRPPAPDQPVLLLVHEATYGPGSRDARLAERRRHSTGLGARLAGASLGAYATVATHFSQRYPRVPDGLQGEWPQEEEELEVEGAAKAAPTQQPPRPPPPPPAAAAFDGMLLPLPLLPWLQPAQAAGAAAAAGGGGGEVGDKGE
jgi:hypothetical protein